MDLHGRIMNLNCVPDNMDADPKERLAYKVGHRDARHAAAELALAATAEIERLRAALRPFAALAEHYPTERKYGNRPTSGMLFEVSSSNKTAGYTVEDLHAAAAAFTADGKA